MRKYINLLIIGILVVVLLLIIQVFKVHYEKKEIVKNFCDNLVLNSKFNWNNLIDNKNIFGDKDIFIYNQGTSLGGFTCTVNLNNEIVVSKSFTSAGFIK